MTLDEARMIYQQLCSSQWRELVDELVACAIRYAELRVQWAQAPIDDRMEIDATRSRAHDAFIDACNIMSRNMAAAGEDNSWRAAIGKDRKSIGDFACMLHCIIGIQAR